MLDTHRDELTSRYASRAAGDNCAGGCGYRFASDTNEIDSLVCPECGHDNLAYFAGKDVWANLERV